MNQQLEDILRIVRDLESFSPTDDVLSLMIQESYESELSENELTFVAAAAQPLPFQKFLARYDHRR